MQLKSFAKFLVEEDIQKIKKSIPMNFRTIDLPISYKDATGKTINEDYTVKVGNAIQGNMKMGFSFDVTTDCARGCPGCYVDAGRKIGCNAKGKFELLEYRNELSKKGYDKFKDITNKNGGIRMFSGGDYIPSSLANNSTNNDLKNKI